MSLPKGQTLRTGTRMVYATSAMWPGIYTGHNALCSCTWARKTAEAMPEVKVRHAACIIHGGASRA